jgi:hypothetical protein
VKWQLAVKTEALRGNLPQSYFVHHKSQMGCPDPQGEKPAIKRPRRDTCSNGGINVMKQFTYLFCQFVYSGSTGAGMDAALSRTLRGRMFSLPLPFVMPGGVSALQNITVAIKSSLKYNSQVCRYMAHRKIPSRMICTRLVF